jgi:hypothetical protein
VVGEASTCFTLPLLLLLLHCSWLLAKMELITSSKLAAMPPLLLLQVSGLLVRGEQHLWGGTECDAARLLYKRLQEAQQWAAQVGDIDVCCAIAVGAAACIVMCGTAACSAAGGTAVGGAGEMV